MNVDFVKNCVNKFTMFIVDFCTCKQKLSFIIKDQIKHDLNLPEIFPSCIYSRMELWSMYISEFQRHFLSEKVDSLHFNNTPKYIFQQDIYRIGYRRRFSKPLRRQSSGGCRFSPDSRRVKIQEYLTLVPVISCIQFERKHMNQ